MQKQGVIRIYSPSPYEEIDRGTAEWLRQLRSMWPLWKNTQVMTDMLFNFFTQSVNPFKAALSIMVSSGDFYSGKQNSLAYEIILSFRNWMRLQNVTEIPKPLKLDAISLVTKQHSLELTKLVIDTFRVKEDKEIFVGHIRELVKKQKYKEACQLASFLGLHEYFGIEEFLVPLIFQDKYCTVEMFLNDSKRHQHELAVFLDNIIGKPSVTQESLNIAEKLNISNVRLTFMKYKSLSKLITKLVKTYDLPPTICPNVNQKKGKGVLQFLLHKRYIEKSISGESWTEMVMEALGNDETLHEELVENLILYRDLKEALVWAERLGVPKERWPSRLTEFHNSGEESKPFERESWDDEGEKAESAESRPVEEESWEDDKPQLDYHKLSLDESQIKVVDTAAGFNDFIVEITNGVSIVGIDAEWKPSFGLRQTDLALMQVATHEAVYILDVVTLTSAAPQPLWERFGSFLFENPNVLKVGFDMRTDLQLVRDTFRKLHCLKSASEVGFVDSAALWQTKAGFLDLAVLWQTLVYNYKFVFPFPSTSNTSANLNRLIQMCLGEVLDKSDQFSNWEKRPLRKSQILYAALDAYCLLEAYDVMVKQAKAQNIPITDIIDGILYDTPTKKAKKKGGKHQYKWTSSK